MHRKILLAALVTAVIGLLLSAYVVVVGAADICPAWPGCNETDMAGLAVAANKLWAMYAHRFMPFAELILLLAALLLGLTSRFRCKPNADINAKQRGLLSGAEANTGLAIVAVAGLAVLVVIAPGYHYHPLLHVGDQLLALAAMAWIYQAWLATRFDASLATVPGPRLLVYIGLLWSGVQIALGAWTAATHSGMACPELPTCMGYWWPDVDYAQGFDVWRGLLEGQFVPMPLAERIAANWVHRVSGLGLVIVLVVTGISLSSGRYGKALSRTGAVINFLAFAQLISALLAVKYHMPVIAVIVHTALAAGLWMHLLRAAHLLAYLPTEVSPPYPPQVQVEPVEIPAPPPAPIASAEPVPEEIPLQLEATPQPVAIPAVVPAEEISSPLSLLQRLRLGLRKTGGGLAGLLAGLSRAKIDDDLLEEIETVLLMADVGVEATQALVKTLATDYPKDMPVNADGMRQLMKQQMLDMLTPCNQPLQIDAARKPFVILVVGVNGVGKTTTIGKLARRYKNDGHAVMLAAGDTFRAAAMEQLQSWGERNDIPVIAQHSGADSASVIFDAMQSAQAKGVDVLIADTAGRLHTKSNLMEELKKIKRILGRLDETAPHEVLLVLDAGTGQNAVAQARQFHEAVNLTGIAVTKLDGTAKGGVIFALARQFGIPIRYIGVGEGIDDLQDFHAETFVEALLGQDNI